MIKISSVYKPRLVIFTKSPQMGSVKTRLAADIGPTAATSWYRSTCARLIRQLSTDARWETYLAVTPETETEAMSHWPSIWPSCVMRVPQGNGDLGARLERVFQFPPGPVLIVGSDIPGITPAHVIQGFKALGDSDAVLGPCQDGGYWAVGLKRLRPASTLFRNVRWSTEHALTDTVRSLAPRRVELLESLIDVDTGADLRLIS